MHQLSKAIVGMTPTRGATIVLLAPLIGTLLLLGSAVPVRAQTLTFTAVLTSGQEPPAEHE
jgi:hypothetical protein